MRFSQLSGHASFKGLVFLWFGFMASSRLNGKSGCVHLLERRVDG